MRTLMLLDAKLFLDAVDRTSPFHKRAAEWLAEHLSGPRPVGCSTDTGVARYPQLSWNHPLL
jgi:hypothetical protein